MDLVRRVRIRDLAKADVILGSRNVNKQAPETLTPLSRGIIQTEAFDCNSRSQVNGYLFSLNETKKRNNNERDVIN